MLQQKHAIVQFETIPLSYRSPTRLRNIFSIRHIFQLLFYITVGLAGFRSLYDSDQLTIWNLFVLGIFASATAILTYRVCLKLLNYVLVYNFETDEITVQYLLYKKRYSSQKIKSIKLDSTVEAYRFRKIRKIEHETRVAWCLVINFDGGHSIGVRRSENGYDGYGTSLRVFFPKIIFTPEADQEELRLLASVLEGAYGIEDKSSP